MDAHASPVSRNRATAAPDNVLVVSLVFNEERNVGAVVAAVLGEGFSAVVVDDGSSDRTAAVARDAGARVLRLPVNLGVGGALRCAFRFAVIEGYDTVVQCDADGQHDPSEIRRLLDTMARTRANLVIGSRFVDGTLGVGAGRGLAMRVLAHIATTQSGTAITDATSGFRAIGGGLLGSFAASYPSEYLGDTVEALARAGRDGHRVEEIAVRMHPRASGVSSASSLASMWYVVRVLAAMRIQRHRPTGRRVVRLTHWEAGPS